MKKITKLGVLAAAAMLMMQGCAAEKENYDKLLDPNKPVTLEIWTYYNGTQKAAFDELVTEFNDTVGAEKGIVVEAYSQGNVNDLITKDVYKRQLETYAVDSRELIDRCELNK